MPKASCWSWDAIGILLELGCHWHPAAPLEAEPSPHAAGMGGDFAAEKETTCKKKPRGGFIRGGRN